MVHGDNCPFIIRHIRGRATSKSFIKLGKTRFRAFANTTDCDLIAMSTVKQCLQKPHGNQIPITIVEVLSLWPLDIGFALSSV
jgi:hypothetical protein